MIVDLLLDPDKALDAVNKAVSLVKKASQTAQNVESLAPLLGRYFDAKANAIATMEKAKAGGFGGSSMGKALELEMAIESQRQFEEDLKGLFFSSNKMDVWQKIKARATQMEADAAKSAAAEKRRLAAAKKKQDEAIEIVIGVSLAVVVVIGLIWAAYEFMLYCSKFGCG
jgi:surfactin synthase thioesterase subunit